MMSLEKQARESLTRLVEHVFAHRSGLITGVTYEQLAAKIGRLNKKGVGHGHGMGAVLGKMGHLLLGLQGEWGEPIPQIQNFGGSKDGQGPAR